MRLIVIWDVQLCVHQHGYRELGEIINEGTLEKIFSLIKAAFGAPVSSTVIQVSVSVLARALTTPLVGVGVSVVGDWSKSKREDLADIIRINCVLGPGAACPMDGGCGYQYGNSVYGLVRQSHLFCCLKHLGDGRSHCGVERSERECLGAESATNEHWNSRSTGDGQHGLGILVCGLQGYRGGDLRSTRRGWNKRARASTWIHRHRSPSRINLGFVRRTLAS